MKIGDRCIFHKEECIYITTSRSGSYILVQRLVGNGWPIRDLFETVYEKRSLNIAYATGYHKNLWWADVGKVESC